MERWEYRVTDWPAERQLEAHLNQLGADGFRLIAAMPKLVFARPIAQLKATPPLSQLSVEDDEIMTIDEVAQMLRVNLARAYDLARSGGLPVIHLGRQLRVRRRALEAWLRESTSQ